MNRLPALIAFAFILCSCSDHSKNELNAFKVLEEGLSSSNERISWQTELLFKSMQDKLMDPCTHPQAALWQPKADSIKQLSSAMVNYIQSLKSDLANEAGYKTKDDRSVSRHDDMGSVTRVFDAKSKGKELFGRLIKYKEDVLSIDEQIKNQFQDHIMLTTRSFDTSKTHQQDFTKTFFTDIPLIAALAMLSKIENNVKVMENDLVSYCYYHIPSGCEWYYDRLAPIIGLSSAIVRPGQTIEITAGIGSFSTRAQPSLQVNGRTINANYDGVIVYKFKSAANPGKHTLPVTISSTKPDGTREIRTMNVEYTVAE